MTYKKAKAAAWREFSNYIRLRDALKTTGDPDRFICFTCGVVILVKDGDAGHAIPGRTAGILFDEEIVRAQCKECNRVFGGEQEKFTRRLIHENGEEWFNNKLHEKRNVVKYTANELMQIAEYYKTKKREMYEGRND